MEIQLAEARPELYLRWIAFVVALEQAVKKNPSLRSKAARRGMVYGPMAQDAHRIVFQPLTAQAEQADEAGTAVRPMLQGEPEQLGEVATYLQRWGEWLVDQEIAERTGVEIPPPEVVALRAQAIKEISQNLPRR
jgi:hypothetical protein